MCGVNGKRGVDYKESSHVLEVVNRGLIILNLKRFSLKFTKCRLVVHTLESWTTILELDDLFTYGQVLFIPMTLQLGFFPSKTC